MDEISARSKSMKETLESQINVLQSQLKDAEDRVGKELDSKYERQRIRSGSIQIRYDICVDVIVGLPYTISHDGAFRFRERNF